jgi:hypothetical protein
VRCAPMAMERIARGRMSAKVRGRRPRGNARPDGGTTSSCATRALHRTERTLKKFLAIYIGTDAAYERAGWSKLSDEERAKRDAAGVQAWMDWGTANAAAIVDQGTPLGKTKRASPQGIADIKNTMTGYVIVQAESHAAAAKLFESHPHFTKFPGDSVEIMECLPLPGM